MHAPGPAFNIVLFNKAARVEEFDLLKATIVKASLGQMSGDGLEPDYSVSEEVPPKASGAGRKPKH